MVLTLFTKIARCQNRWRCGGGVCLYVSDNLNFRICTDIYAFEVEVMESLFIEIDPMREMLLLV